MYEYSESQQEVVESLSPTVAPYGGEEREGEIWPSVALARLLEPFVDVCTSSNVVATIVGMAAGGGIRPAVLAAAPDCRLVFPSHLTHLLWPLVTVNRAGDLVLGWAASLACLPCSQLGHH